MKIAGIFPTKVKQDIEIDLSTEQPLGIAYVIESTKKAGHDAALYYGTPPLEKLLNSDVVAFSLLTKDVPVGLDIAKKVKNSNPNIVTVVGGPHISGDPNFVLEDSIDYGVIGEGEETFVELLRGIEQIKEPIDIKGIVYSKNGKVVSTGKRERIDNLNGLRPVRVSDFYNVYDASLYYPAPSERRFIPILASRGCTMDCEFCGSKLIWNKQIKYRSSSDFLSELEELTEDKSKDLFFLDEENFFNNPGKAREIITSLIGKGHNLASCGDTRLVDSEMLSLLKKAGWTSLLWGIESLNPEIVSKEKKGSSPEHVYEILKKSESLGVFNHGLIMIGFDYEKEQDILKYAQELPYYPIHQLRVSIATPFPGTAFEKRLKRKGIEFDSNLSNYDTGHLVYEHPSISPERMIELQHKIIREFYQSKQWNKRITQMAKDFPHLKKSIGEFREYILHRL